MAGEYTSAVIKAGIEAFVREWLPASLKRPSRAPLPIAAELRQAVPMRPVGSLRRLSGAAPVLVDQAAPRELGPFNISADIGCHSFSTLPPFDLGSTIMGYGLGAASAAAFNVGHDRRAGGDDGRRRLLAQRPHQRHRQCRLQQARRRHRHRRQRLLGGDRGPEHPIFPRRDREPRRPAHSIETAVRGVGVDWVRTVRTYDMPPTIAALREALTTTFAGPKVIVAEGECQLTRQRRIVPVSSKAAGARASASSAQRFGDRRGPLHRRPFLHPTVGLPVADDQVARRPAFGAIRSPWSTTAALGCGVCGEVAHAASSVPRSIAPM